MSWQINAMIHPKNSLHVNFKPELQIFTHIPQNQFY
jgi:hypothetical protein